MLPLLLCFAWVTSGCDSSTSAPEAPAFDASALSGEDLFSGLVLGDGPAAFAVPELWGAHDVRGAIAERGARSEGDAAVALAEARAAVVAYVAEADPAFFDRFKADITSGSPLRVQRALQETATTVLSEFVSARRRVDDGAVVIYYVDGQVILDVDLNVDMNVHYITDLQTSHFVFYLPPTLPSFASQDVSAERVSALVAERLYVPGR